MQTDGQMRMVIVVTCCSEEVKVGYDLEFFAGLQLGIRLP
jgi:hypothetical protein